MTSLAPSTTTVKHHLQFAVGTSIPFIYGAQDAATGMACVPEMVFVTRKDQCDYAAGFESISGPTFATNQFLGSRN